MVDGLAEQQRRPRLAGYRPSRGSPRRKVLPGRRDTAYDRAGASLQRAGPQRGGVSLPAYILRTPQGFLLVDSSLHGTYVNAERVQAQRILADGDLIQVGGHSFRFDLRSAAAHPADPPLASLDPLETSQYATTVPAGAHATGKVRLALALTEQATRQGRLRGWIKRYGPSEVAGIGMALAGSWLVQQVTGSVVAAAYGAAIGEGLGFYGSLVIREMIQEAYFAGARRAPYGAAEMMRSWACLRL